VHSARASRAHSQPGLRPRPPLNINALRVNLVNIDIVDELQLFNEHYIATNVTSSLCSKHRGRHGQTTLTIEVT